MLFEKDFDGIGNFVDGIGRVKINEQWKFIDKSGNLLFERLIIEKAEDFSNGYARVQRNNKWGFINTKGEIVIEPIFENAWDFMILDE